MPRQHRQDRHRPIDCPAEKSAATGCRASSPSEVHSQSRGTQSQSFNWKRARVEVDLEKYSPRLGTANQTISDSTTLCPGSSEQQRNRRHQMTASQQQRRRRSQQPQQSPQNHYMPGRKRADSATAPPSRGVTSKRGASSPQETGNNFGQRQLETLVARDQVDRSSCSSLSPLIANRMPDQAVTRTDADGLNARKDHFQGTLTSSSSARKCATDKRSSQKVSERRQRYYKRQTKSSDQIIKLYDVSNNSSVVTVTRTRKLKRMLAGDENIDFRSIDDRNDCRSADACERLKDYPSESPVSGRSPIALTESVSELDGIFSGHDYGHQDPNRSRSKRPEHSEPSINIISDGTNTEDPKDQSVYEQEQRKIEARIQSERLGNCGPVMASLMSAVAGNGNNDDELECGNQIDLQKTSTSGELANANPRKRPIASYFKQNFCGKDATWETDLADEFSDELSTDDQETGSNKQRISTSDEGVCVSRKFDNVFDSEFLSEVRGVKKRAAIAGSAKGATRSRSTSISVPKMEVSPSKRQIRDLCLESNGKQISSCNNRQIDRSVNSYFDLKAPSATLKQCEVASGKPSSSTISDSFETGSRMSKVRLTRRSAGHSAPLRPGRSAPALLISLDNVKLLVERNLVATLVGVYILVSLTVIVVLILPYVFNIPNSIAAVGTGDERDSVRDIFEEHTISALGQHYRRGQKVLHQPMAENHHHYPQQHSREEYAIVSLPTSASKSTQTSSVGMLATGESVDKFAHVVNRVLAKQIKDRQTKVQDDKVSDEDIGSIDRDKSGDKMSDIIDMHVSKLSKKSAKFTSSIDPMNTSNSGGSSIRLNSNNKLRVAEKAPNKLATSTMSVVKQQPHSTESKISGAGAKEIRSIEAAVSPGSNGSGMRISTSPENTTKSSSVTEPPKVNEKFHSLWNMAHSQECQPLKVPTCSRTIQSMLTGSGGMSQRARSALSSAISSHAISGIPYDKTLLPNQFTRTQQSQIEKMLSKFDAVIDIKCYPLMPLFLCSLYAPKCIPLNQTQVRLAGTPMRVMQEPQSPETFGNQPGDAAESASQMGESSSDMLYFSDSSGLKLVTKLYNINTKGSEHWSRLVPPCRSLCREALRRCTFFFEVLSLKLIQPEDCEALPESSNPDICIGQLENNLLIRSNAMQTCQEDKFMCTDGECIPKKWRCDGYADCTDKSDETKCSRCNVETQFYCGQEVCINKVQVCNGIRDCRDGRDERQCLRLSNATQYREGQRRLEVWNAVKNDWVSVCGAHWSPMPMSHEACQSLGYSRANKTLILYGPKDPSNPSGRSTGQASRGLNKTASSSTQTGGPSTVPTANLTSISSQNSPNQRSTGGGWFNIAPGTTYIAFPGIANPGEDPNFAKDFENEQLVGVVEDVAAETSSVGLKNNRQFRTDHQVIFERQQPIASGSMRPLNADQMSVEQTASIYGAEVKLRSINSMLYHGAQAGCVDRPARVMSSVYLQCQNFQCGRSVTSYSTRVRLLAQQVSYSAQPPPTSPAAIGSIKVARSVKTLTLRSSAAPEPLPSEGGLQRDHTLPVLGTQERQYSHLEAQEELGSEGDSEVADQEQETEDEDDDDYEDGESAKDVRFIDQLAKLNDAPQTTSKGSVVEPNPISQRLVVGGIESMPGEFPYLAALHGGPDEVFFCGGVLIGINWLLTAAHCVGNRTQPDGWMVKVGVTRRIASPAFVRKLKVREIIKHPKFNIDSMFNNDIALILLEESVEFNQYLKPICLPRANLRLGPDNSKDCVVVGFGKSRFSQEANYLHVAHFVNVPIVHHSVCSSWYAEHGVNLTEGMLCAGYAEGKRDACQGDSGSGLFCRYSNTNQFFVAGVVSFGIKCATPKLPGVYTSVPLYVDWIEATTRELGYPLG